MCGIFGWRFAEVGQRRLTVLAADLALQNDIRGGDSWGYWSPPDSIQRGLGDIAPRSAALAKHPVLFAHTRAASTGAVTVKNSHPFKIGSIIGAHNGMIVNHDDLNRRYKRSFTVDSQHIFAHLAEQRSITELQGWGAIEWVNLSDGAIYVCKLSERASLAVARCTNPAGVVWSSDAQHLTAALHAARLDFNMVQVNPFVVLEIGWDNAYYVGAQPYHQLRLGEGVLDSRAVNRYALEVPVEQAYCTSDLERELEHEALSGELRFWTEMLEADPGDIEAQAQVNDIRHQIEEIELDLLFSEEAKS